MKFHAVSYRLGGQTRSPLALNHCPAQVCQILWFLICLGLLSINLLLASKGNHSKRFLNKPLCTTLEASNSASLNCDRNWLKYSAITNSFYGSLLKYLKKLTISDKKNKTIYFTKIKIKLYQRVFLQVKH